MAVDTFADRPQTNIQLYRALLAEGRSIADLRQIHDAYNLAAKLFAGQIRPEGRPFICHLVGIAGILATLGEPSFVVCAALLHSAIPQGDVGAGRGEVGGVVRRLLVRSMDPRIVALVEGYDQLAWNAKKVEAWTAAGNLGDTTLRNLIVMRLANELEDALDGGLDFSGKGDQRRHMIAPASIVALAKAIGEPRLAVALEATLLATAPMSGLGFLQAQRCESVIEAPLSYRRKVLGPIALRFQDYANQGARRLSRLFSGAADQKKYPDRPIARDPT